MAPIISGSESDWYREAANPYAEVLIASLSMAGFASVLLLSLLVCECCKKEEPPVPEPEPRREPELPPVPQRVEASAMSGDGTTTPTPTPTTTPRAMRVSVTTPLRPDDAPPLTLESWKRDSKKISSPFYRTRSQSDASSPMPSLSLMSSRRSKGPTAKPVRVNEQQGDSPPSSTVSAATLTKSKTFTQSESGSGSGSADLARVESGGLSLSQLKKAIGRKK